MRLKNKYVLYSNSNEYMMIATSKATRDFNVLVRNNETTKFMLKKLQNEITEAELVDAMPYEYEVDIKTAE